MPAWVELSERGGLEPTGAEQSLGSSTPRQGFGFLLLELWDPSKAGRGVGAVVGVRVIFAF